MTALAPNHVVVQFGPGFTPAEQGPLLLAFEQMLRRRHPGRYIEVFKDAKGDDSKLRASMTKEQRAKL